MQGVVMITGASLGIGLELARQYAARNWTVYATHRQEQTPETLTSACKEHPNIHPERMDITDPKQVASLAGKLSNTPIDILINNAGVAYDENLSLDSQNLGTLDFTLGQQIFAVNLQGALRVTEAFLSHVAAGTQKKIVSMSSATGSLTHSLPGGGGIFYRASKAALNRAMMSVAVAVRDAGVTVVLLHPGAVATERNVEFSRRNDAARSAFPNLISTRSAVAQMIDTIDGLGLDDTGRFINFDGTPAPW